MLAYDVLYESVELSRDIEFCTYRGSQHVFLDVHMLWAGVLMYASQGRVRGPISYEGVHEVDEQWRKSSMYLKCEYV